MSGAEARLEEASLITRARNGDQVAFGQLVERYQVAVYNLCYRMLGQSEEAEDAAQEVFLRIYRQLGAYNSAHRFSTWVLSIASHYCIDQLRKRRLTVVPIESIINWARSRQPQPDDLALEGEQRDQIQALLHRLPEKYRLALVLRYWHDLSYNEISEVIGQPVSTVRMRLFRARQSLGKSCEAELTQARLSPAGA